MTAEPRVSVDQSAEHAGVTRDATCRWLGRKHLRALCVGRSWKFKASELDDGVRRWRGSAQG